jgi:D-alanine--D-alanine ligase
VTEGAGGLRIALIHNLKPPVKDPSLPDDYYSECDSPKTIAAIVKALEGYGHTVLTVEADRDLPRWLSDHPVDLAFNIAEGFEGEAREARVPALLELLGIPYTGSGVLALALALDKAKSKQIFCQTGVPTPAFQLFLSPHDPLNPNLRFPLIVKPNREGSAKGLFASSVVHDETGLVRQVRFVMERYRQEALVEEYIDGKELTVGILGEEVLPILEIDFEGCKASGEFFYSWRMKEFQGDRDQHLDPHFWCPARLSEETAKRVRQVAWKAAKALGTRDMARVDIRLGLDGIPYVLEVNPLPGLDPEESNLPIMIRAAGISYEDFIHRLVRFALHRGANGLETKSMAPDKDRGAPSSIVSSRKSTPIPVPVGEVLPDSVGIGAGSLGSAGGNLKTLSSVAQGIRVNDPKEGHIGR